ncbi:MAG TPA: hypothetical protein VFS32_11840 [Candidatus Limnocylindrales bacterium]|nr:hypothetical protein [Candidatus Limnocylindrales bacterium]
MARFVKLVVVAVAAVLAGCSSTPAAQTDPYAIAKTAASSPWDRVQVDVGLKATSGSQTIQLDPGAIRFVMDTKAGKGSFHVSLPASSLGADAASLAMLGITNGSIDLDVLYDGDALYARSPLAATLLPALLAQSGNVPSGDLTGWLKVATKSDFDALAATAGASAAPSSANLASLDPAAIKSQLEAAGVTLAYAGTTAHNGADAYHVTIALDMSKLSNAGSIGSLSTAQLQQLTELSKTTSLSGDVWVDKGSGRLSEIDMHGSATGTDGGTFDLSLALSEPASGTSFDAPSSSVDVPISSLLGPILQMAGQSGLGTP